MRKIEDLLARRSDLSTFLVHLTRTRDDVAAKDRLKSILEDRVLKACDPMGHAVQTLRQKGLSLDTQRCVAFTETPLEHVSLLLGPIEDRTCQFEPYGIAITKKQGRTAGVNPVWYVDITPGHDWLSKSINSLIDSTIASGNFDASPVASLTPFIEQMGSGARADGTGGYRKEFWWEREWRNVGDFYLPWKLIVFCPEEEHADMRGVLDGEDEVLRARFVDPRWSLEQIIGRLAGFGAGDVGPF